MNTLWPLQSGNVFVVVVGCVVINNNNNDDSNKIVLIKLIMKITKDQTVTSFFRENCENHCAVVWGGFTNCASGARGEGFGKFFFGWRSYLNL